MKIAGRDVRRALAAPDPAILGFLIYGADDSAVALRRAELVAALLGDGADDMRLERLEGASVRRDPALLADALRSMSFFGGRRVVELTGATDGLADAVAAALDGVRTEDTVLVASAGSLAARSSLRRLFEGGAALAAAPVYADPPSRGEIEDDLRRLGAPAPDAGAAEDLTALGRVLDVGEHRALLAKLALYKAGDRAPISRDDVAACAPAAPEEAADDLVSAALAGELDALTRGLARTSGAASAPVSISLAASRRLRQLHALASAPDGPEAAVGRIRPPVWGARRQELTRQARKWDRRRLEQALRTLTEAELELRSSGGAPAMAVVERALVRVTLLAQQSAR